MKRQLSILAMAAILPAISVAQSNKSYECTNGGSTRRVEIAYTGTGQVPCEVRYTKPSEAPGAAPAVLWQATNETGYCEARATEFVDKLRGMGWTCSDGTAAAAAPRPAGDDTAILGAGR